MPEKIPLCVDLDGTLIQTDVIHVALKAYCHRRPWRWIQIGLWLLHGRAYFKARLHQAQTIEPQILPYDKRIIRLIQDYKAKGHLVYLATAANVKVAQLIVDHVQLFDGIIASDAQHNYRAAAKGKILTEKFGLRGFLYIGNSQDDLKVWSLAAGGYVVNASPKVLAKACQMGIRALR